MSKKTTAYSRRRRHVDTPRQFSLARELMASPTEPMPRDKRERQLLAMWSGLSALEVSASPTNDDWRVVSDAVNLMETLVEMGECEDASGLLVDAVVAMGAAGQRSMQGQTLRLDGRGIQTVRAVLEDYAAVLEALPERAMVRAHRLTELRIINILARHRSNGVHVVDLQEGAP